MKKHTTKLIDSSFSIPKAKNLLYELLVHKISYHRIEKFSTGERPDADREQATQRINDLLDEKQALTEWLNSLPPGRRIKINCLIKMETTTTAGTSRSRKPAAALADSSVFALSV